MTKLVVIGAGAMGLAAAYHALKAGHQVDVVEAHTKPGGMAQHVDFGGMSIEAYYHFICKTDAATFALLDELGIGATLRWRATSMGYFIDGRSYRWGDPVALLTFPLLSPLSKLRYGLQMFLSTKARNFDAIENLNARDWIIGGAGRQSYNVLWKRLLDLKFFELADDISASWIATRIRRIGKSRRSLFQEELGYLEGGTETLVTALVHGIESLGGRIHLKSPVQEIVADEGRVTGVRTEDGLIAADAVISTVPTPHVPDMVPAMSPALKARYREIKNIGVVCLMLKLRKSVSPHFWVNINQSDIEFPGIIEFSNLRPMPQPVVYVPYYMPHGHPKWQWSDAQFVAEAMAGIRKINPEITDAELIDSRVTRLRYAQPVCEPEFLKKLPPVQTEIAGLQIADTCFYYPEDRGISESVDFGKMMAANLQ